MVFIKIAILGKKEANMMNFTFTPIFAQSSWDLLCALIMVPQV
jgi:hypothetical protein